MRYGPTKTSAAAIAVSAAAPGDPPPAADRSGEGHHDQQRDADRDEGRPEPEPAAEQPLEVADLGDVVPALPPDRRDRERQLREPDDRQAQHPEKHPRADRPRGRFLRVPGAPARIDRQRHEHDDLGGDPVGEQEPLVALRPLDQLAAEHRVDVDPWQHEVVGDDGVQQEPGGERRARGDGGRDEDVGGAGHVATSGSAGGSAACAPGAGEESG